MIETTSKNIFTVKNGFKFGIGFVLARMLLTAIDKSFYNTLVEAIKKNPELVKLMDKK